jgi:enoyl-[acyl-carrier protein] reductase I
MGFLAGKRALVVGVASNRSIAWGVAQALHRQGAELVLSYQGDKLQERVEKLGKEVNATACLSMDVAEDTEIDAAFSALADTWNRLDILIHSVGFAPREQLDGRYIDCVTRDGFRIAHDISSYSFPALARAARPLLHEGASLLTLSYLGAIRAIPNYNVMGPAKASLEANVRFMAADLGRDGIRVNGVSAGPIKTLASAGIGNFRYMLNYVADGSALKRNATVEDVGNTVAFLSSGLAAGITGEIVYVDCGFHIMGMAFPEQS